MFSEDRDHDSLAGANALTPDGQTATHTNSKILAIVEQEFSRMEAEHTRIRIEELANRVVDETHPGS